MKRSLFFGFIFVVASTSLVVANYRNPDKEYSIVKVGANEFFDDVDCSDVKGRTFERGLYYYGTACQEAEEGDKFCVCFRWVDELEGEGKHFDKICGMCRDPNALILA